MRVAGCIVLISLFLPVFTVPVPNGENSVWDCEDTSESTSVAVSPSGSASVSVASAVKSTSTSAGCGPVPKNTVANFPDALPNQYIVSLKPNANLTLHLANVQAALAADRLCGDPGAPKSYLDSKQVVIKDNYAGTIYRGNFTDRDVAFIQNTPELQSIARDRAAIELKKRAVGTTWNLARLAQPDKLQPGQNGQGASDTSTDWSVGLRDGLGQDVYIYVLDTGVDGDNPLLTPRVHTGTNIQDRGPGNVEGDGHGTEVAGAAAAHNFGVASAATIVPIKLYESPQAHSLSSLVSGVEAAVDNFRLKKAVNPKAAAVINISVSSPNELDLEKSIAEALEENMHVVIAAGNDKEELCNGDTITAKTNTKIQAAINVGAIDIHDHIALWPSATAPGSNYGECVDIYAGGNNILTSGPNKLPTIASGTSLAAPQVAGIIAAIISTTDQGFRIRPADMKDTLLKAGVTGKIQGLSADSNNLIAQLPDSLKQAISTANPLPSMDSEAPHDADSVDDWGEFAAGDESHDFKKL